MQLFPRGPELGTLPRDGRRWQMPDPGSVARRSEELRGGVDLAVDWEHAQDRRAKRGEEAPAAGWISEIAMRDGVLAARVNWTARGRASVESREYRYISPAFTHARRITPGDMDGGRVVAVIGAGLVNRPAFDSPSLAGAGEESSMLKKILEALGLAADAAEERAIAAIVALKTERDTAVAQAAAPPLDRFVPCADYDSAVARATAAEEQVAEARDEEIERLLDEAQEAGKITPKTREYHKGRCQAEGGIAAFKEFCKETPELPGPGGGSAAPPAPGTGSRGFASPEEAAIAGMFGRDAKFLDKHAPREVS